MKTLKIYCSQLNQKTLFIFCNDCYCMNSLVSCDDFIVCTAFGNIINTQNNYDSSYFKHTVKQENIEQIIIAGHYHCKILYHILGHKSNPFLSPNQAHNEYSLLQKSLNLVPYSNSNKWQQFVDFHIALQVRNLCQLPSIRVLKERQNIKVKGIIINENDGNKVIELDISKALKAYSILN